MIDAGEFDYVIAGGGTAGCVVAARLTEDPNVTVCLLEAGPSDVDDPRILRLEDWMYLLDSGYDWDYLVEPQARGNSFLRHARGKVLGGCSSINGMMYSRGNRADYDDWARMGLSGWSFADVLPYFRKSEANWRGESAFHGASGPLTVSRHRTDQFVYPRMIQAAESMGFRHLDDFHGAEQEGFSAPDFNVHRGRRASTSRRYLGPALSRANLTVATEALALRVLVEQGRAIGVQ